MALLTEGFKGQGVVGDWDGDGDEDVYVLRDGANELFDNKVDDSSSITVRPEGYISNLSGIGSKVRVYRAGEVSLCGYREVTGSQGSPLEVTIGVNSSDLLYDVEVEFPSGEVVKELDVGAGQRLKVSERGYVTVRNAGFEQVRGDEIGYWTPYGTGDFGSSFSERKEGDFSAHLSRASGGDYFGFRQGYIQVQPNTTYYLGVWVKTQASGGSVWAALGVWGDGNHHSDFGGVGGNSDWQFIWGSWTSGDNENRIEIRLYGSEDFVGEAWFDGIYFGTEPPIPAAPGELACSAVSSVRIDLSWADNSDNEEGFKIERSTDGVNFSQIATVGPNTTSYSNTGLLRSITTG